MIQLNLVQVLLRHHWHHKQQFSVHFICTVLIIELHLIIKASEDLVYWVASHSELIFITDEI